MSRRLEHHLNHIGNERVDYYCGTRFKDACLIRIHIFIIDSLVCPYTENPIYFSKNISLNTDTMASPLSVRINRVPM